ncbi:hypothetical protein [Agromyces allii]|uniref:hypothetical protein n=1 Tax=Agromyces allii TaxID=393607 RepID=UPI0012F7E480|nr:hypothetical protein [Agromyces allii]
MSTPSDRHDYYGLPASVADTLTRPRDPKARRTTRHPALITSIIGAVITVVAFVAWPTWWVLLAKLGIIVTILQAAFWGFAALGYRPFAVVGWKVSLPPFLALILMTGWLHIDVNAPESAGAFMVMCLVTTCALPALGFMIGPPVHPSMQEPEWFVIFALVVAFVAMYAVAWFIREPACDLRVLAECSIPW